MSEIAKKRIEECIATQSPFLDLGNCGLTDLKQQVPELAKCTHIEGLNLGSQWYEYNGERVITIKSRNDFERNDIQIDNPFIFSKFKRLKYFYAQGIFLSAPGQFFDFDFLSKEIQTIDISDSELKVAQFSFKKYQNLTSIFIEKSYIEPILLTLSDQSTILLSESIQCVSLFLSNIRKLPKIDSVANLEYLDISGTKIGDLTSVLIFINLKTLWASNLNYLKTIPLEHLSNLERLSLYSSSVSDYSFLLNLKKLKELNLGKSKLYANSYHFNNPEYIKNAIQLEILNLTETAVEDLIPLTSLKNLKELRLTGTQVKTLDLKTLNAWPKLKTLLISKTPFWEENELEQERGRSQLEVVRNFLLRQEEENRKIVFKLPAKVMLLGNHQAGKSSVMHYLLEGKLTASKNSTHLLAVHPYPKQQPRSKTKTLPQAIFYDFGGQDYYHGLYRAFLSLHGLHVLLFCKDSNKNQLRTDSNGLENRDFHVGYWLGQKKYLEKDNSPDSLLLIQSHADKDGRLELPKTSPGFHIENAFHVSLKEGLEATETFSPELNAHALAYLKANIEHFIARTQRHREEPPWYEAFLQYTIARQTKALHRPVPVHSLLDKYLLKEAKDDEDRLANLKVELRQLHLQGLVLYYDEIETLSEHVWLNPVAFTKFVHDKLLNKNILKGKGKQRRGQLPAFEFEKLKVDARTLELLEAQKVLFKHAFQDDAGNEQTEYIVPNFLPLAEEEKEEYDLFTFGLQQAAFTLKFAHFLPMGLINRLISDFGKLPHPKRFWRNQLLFILGASETDSTSEASSKVLIRIDYETLEIKVHIAPNGTIQNVLESHTQYLFDYLLGFYADLPFRTLEEAGSEPLYAWHYLDEVRRAASTDDPESTPQPPPLQNAQLQEKIQDELAQDNAVSFPTDCFISLDGKQFIRLEALMTVGNASSIAAYTYHAETETHTLDPTPVKAIPVYPFQLFTPNRLTRMKKLFISYSHDDIAYRREVQSYLVNLEREGTIRIWEDSQISTGTDWNDTILSNLESADIIVLLVSQSFIASTYVHEKEMRKAIRKAAEGSAKIFPVLLKNCDWANWKVFAEGVEPTDINGEAGKMGNYQFSPMDENQRLKPINRWEFPEDAWTKMANDIRQVR